MLSMKFPHLFLRPEIIITFLWVWEWIGGGGGGGGRCDTTLRGILVLTAGAGQFHNRNSSANFLNQATDVCKA